MYWYDDYGSYEDWHISIILLLIIISLILCSQRCTHTNKQTGSLQLQSSALWVIKPTIQKPVMNLNSTCANVYRHRQTFSCRDNSSTCGGPNSGQLYSLPDHFKSSDSVHYTTAIQSTLSDDINSFMTSERCLSGTKTLGISFRVTESNLSRYIYTNYN